MREGSFDEAYSIVSTCFPVLGSEEIAIHDAVGRIAAVDLHSLCNLPAYTTSSMDGWAVCSSGPWQIVGEVHTGRASERSLNAGECMRIGTGGVIPEGCTAVLPWEEAVENEGAISGVIADGANFRPAALECKVGDLLTQKGSKLSPAMVGLLAATGHDRILVTKIPRIAIFFLGDELMHEGVPEGGAIRDALGPQLPALLRSYGGEIYRAQFVRDNLDSLHEAITSVLPDVDMIFTTGGTADGAQDFIRPVISKFGAEYLVDCVRVRPGYHMIFSAIPHHNRTVPFVALPGNPQSALAALNSLGRLALSSIMGKNLEPLRTVFITEALKTPKDFSRFVPGVLSGDQFTPTHYLNSAMLRGVASADGFALVDPGEHPVGAQVRWISF